MSKLAKIIIAIASSVAVITVGIVATVLIVQNSKSNITFSATDVYIGIEATCTVGDDVFSEYSGTTGTTDKPAENAKDWNIGDIQLSGDNYTVEYAFAFKNNGNNDAVITFTPPTLTAEQKALLTLTSNGVTDNVVEVAKGETKIVTYTVTVLRFDKDIPASAFNFVVSMTKKA